MSRSFKNVLAERTNHIQATPSDALNHHLTANEVRNDAHDWMWMHFSHIYQTEPDRFHAMSGLLQKFITDLFAMKQGPVEKRKIE